MQLRLAGALAASLLAPLAACDRAAPPAGEPGGTLIARVDGERFVEEGMPASMFADGWSLRFDQFLVSVGEVTAHSEGRRVVAGGYRILDLARPSGGAAHALLSAAAPDGAYDRFHYTIAPAPDAQPGNVSPADANAMQRARASVHVRATATKDGRSHRLDLAFSPRLAHDCKISSAIRARTAEQASLELRATLHADHLLMDNTPESNLRLGILVAADGADGSTPDGVTTSAELAATRIDDNADYKVKSAKDLSGAPIVTLHQYLERRLATIGHVDGELPCKITGTPQPAVLAAR